jgi:uncharacterized protein YndB with AHSA1/START domain
MRWKQWLLTIVLLLVALFIIAYGLGKRVPVEHTSVASATISASQAQVWAMLVNVDAYPTWRSDVKAVDELPTDTGRRRWRESYGHFVMTFILDDNQPMTSRVVRLEPEGASFDGSWTFQLIPLDDGRTTVTIIEHGHTYSPLYRFMQRYITGTDFEQKRYLRDLGRKLESR